VDKTTKVTAKSQVTIPKPVREKMGIEVGDELLFEYQEGNLVVKKHVPKDSFEKYRGKLKHLRGQKSDEIVARSREHQ